MDRTTAELVEHYQKMLEQDPNSRIFATLADAYRKAGMLREAKDVADTGVVKHPNFPSGRLALAKILLELTHLEEALTHLQTAAELSPENILAHSLLADTLLRLRRPKAALSAYKMLLFLHPENAKAQKAVQKLESLTADEYEDDVFQMRPLKENTHWGELDASESITDSKIPNPESRRIRNLDRILSLVDAYIVRNDMDRALETLQEGEKQLGSDPEIIKRLRMVHQRQLEAISPPKNANDLLPPLSPQRDSIDKKIQHLQDLLHQIKTHSP